MTDKQHAIVESALILFSDKGYDAVSTSAISKHAGVSEGLIFRHFNDKKGLLNSLLEIWIVKFEQHLHAIESIEKTDQKIQAVMELPFRLDEADYPYWKLVYSLKWQNNKMIGEYMLTLKDLLEKSLVDLKYPDPLIEAELIISYFDGFITTVVLKNDSSLASRLLQTLQKKYV